MQTCPRDDGMLEARSPLSPLWVSPLCTRRIGFKSVPNDSLQCVSILFRMFGRFLVSFFPFNTFWVLVCLNCSICVQLANRCDQSPVRENLPGSHQTGVKNVAEVGITRSPPKGGTPYWERGGELRGIWLTGGSRGTCWHLAVYMRWYPTHSSNVVYLRRNFLKL